MTPNNTIAAGAVCVLLAGLPACNSADTAAKSPYPIVDSGTWAPDSPGIYWIDNNRILFKTVKDNNKHLAFQGPYNLSIWEVGKGVKPYTPFAHRVTACLSDGIFRYELKDEQKNVQVFHGKFGEEKLVDLPKMTYSDPMNCRVEDNPEIAEKYKNNRVIIKLLDRHGYLDVGAAKGEESLQQTLTVLYRPGKREGITLPTRIAYIEYYAFKDAYFAHGLSLYDQRNQPGIVRWLFPDGKVEEVQVPASPWEKGISQAFPTRQGIFAVSYNFKSVRDPGNAGGYFLQGNKFTKVIDGSIDGTAVSPDGCKVAFSHVLYTDADAASISDPTLRTLKLINFCTEEKRHGK